MDTSALFSWKETGKPRLGILPLLRKLHFVFYIYVYFFAQAQNWIQLLTVAEFEMSNKYTRAWHENKMTPFAIEIIFIASKASLN